jgi:VWFA-related protein
MKTRFILGCAILGFGVCAFGQSSSKDLPEAPSATIAPKPQAPTQDRRPAAQAPATDSDAPGNQQPSTAQPAGTSQPSAETGAKSQPANPPSGNPAQQNQPAASQKPSEGQEVNGPAETIKRTVNEVNVVFTVTDKHGRFVKDLKKEDIKVLDDNKPQEIRSFRSETDLPLRVGLLIDASNSIRDRFKFEQEAAIEFLNQIVRSQKDKAFVIGFDSVSEVTQDYTDSTESLARGVRMLKAGGGTALFDAVYYACREKLMNPPASSEGGSRRAIILLSDGEDNQSRVAREEAVEMAQRAEVIIYVISTNITGIKTRGDKVLERFAEMTGGRLFTPFKLQDVADAFTEIQDELRSQYAISYHPPDFALDGRYRSISIDAPAKKNLRVRARKGYYAPKAVATTSENAAGDTAAASVK